MCNGNPKFILTLFSSFEWAIELQTGTMDHLVIGDSLQTFFRLKAYGKMVSRFVSLYVLDFSVWP